MFSTLKAFIAAQMTSVITLVIVIVAFVLIGTSQVAPTTVDSFVARSGMSVTVHTQHAHDNDEEVVFTAAGTVQQWDENAGKTVTIPCIIQQEENKTVLTISGRVYTGNMSEMSSDQGWYSVDNLK